MPSSIVISAASVAVAPGYTALVPLNLSNTGTFAPGSFQLDLTFDPQLLTFVSAAAGAVLSAAGAVLSSSVVATGDLHLSAAAAGGNTIPSGVLLSVSFTATPQFAASSPLTFLNCGSTNATGQPLSTGCNGGAVVLFTCDIGGFGSVTVADVQSIMNEALGAAAAKNDLNQDGVVNVADLQKVMDAALGLGCPYR